MLSFFLSCCDKIPDQGNLREYLFILIYSFKVQSIVEGNSNQQDLKGAAFFVTVVKIQTDEYMHMHAFSTLYSLGMAPPSTKYISPYQLT